MSVGIPNPINTRVTVAQPFRTKVEGIPSSFSVGVTDLPDLNISVETIPVLHLSVDNIPPVHVSVDNLPPLHVSVDSLPPINITLSPIEIRLTELPSTRVHIPADFSFGWSMLGMDFGTLRLCGEAQVITEPYRPNPCEGCGPAATVPVPAPPRQTGPIVTKPGDVVTRPKDPATPHNPG